MLKQSLVALGLVASAVACSAPDSTDVKATPDLDTVHPQMVNGTASPTSQDSVVMIAMGDIFCTATLIAPDLLITAHHCVAQENQDQNAPACSPLGTPFDPSVFEVKLNAPGAGASQDFENGATYQGPTVAHATQVWTTTTNNICSFDVAIIKLDTAIPNAKTSNLRFSALQPNEAVTAVGFGDDGQGDYPSARQQRSTNVLGVGPTTVQFQSQSDGTIPLSLPQGDVMTGESHCFGDSGGPLFDKDGNIVAIISRGPDDAPFDVRNRGQENCIDMAEVYSGVAFNEAFIREAVKEAGHTLSAGTVGSTQNIPVTQSTSGTTKPVSTKKTSTGDDDDDDDDDSTATKHSSTSAAPLASSSCSSVPGPAGDRPAYALLFGFATLLLATRRRR